MLIVCYLIVMLIVFEYFKNKHLLNLLLQNIGANPEIIYPFQVNDKNTRSNEPFF